MATVREQLLAIIADSGLSPYEIAKQSGVERSALSRFINGKGGLTVESLEKLSPVLGLKLVTTRARTVRVTVTNSAQEVRATGYLQESKPLLSVPVRVRKKRNARKSGKER